MRRAATAVPGVLLTLLALACTSSSSGRTADETVVGAGSGIAAGEPSAQDAPRVERLGPLPRDGSGRRLRLRPARRAGGPLAAGRTDAVPAGDRRRPAGRRPHRAVPDRRPRAAGPAVRRARRRGAGPGGGVLPVGPGSTSAARGPARWSARRCSARGCSDLMPPRRRGPSVRRQLGGRRENFGTDRHRRRPGRLRRRSASTRGRRRRSRTARTSASGTRLRIPSTVEARARLGRAAVGETDLGLDEFRGARRCSTGSAACAARRTAAAVRRTGQGRRLRRDVTRQLVDPTFRNSTCRAGCTRPRGQAGRAALQFLARLADGSGARPALTRDCTRARSASTCASRGAVAAPRRPRAKLAAAGGRPAPGVRRYSRSTHGRRAATARCRPCEPWPPTR